MKIANFSPIALCLVYVLACLPEMAQELKRYPGAQFDEKVSRQASQAAPGKQSEVYTTADTFENVYAFYKRLYKEYTMPMPQLPSGKKLQWAFFILDGGKNLSASKYWIKIQRPYVGTVADVADAEFQDIRDVTAIQTVHPK